MAQRDEEKRVKQILTEQLLNYLTLSGSPYHAVHELKLLLEEYGYKQLNEQDYWKLEPGKKYYLTKNASCIMAFYIGKNYLKSLKRQGKGGGFIIGAAHTDSPCLKLRPNGESTSEEINTMNVECYGGGLWHTWFDRGLGVAGKVAIKQPLPSCRSSDADPWTVVEKLVRIDRPICIIPNLAIHLQTAEERSAFKFSRESQLKPLLSNYLRVAYDEYTSKTPLLDCIASELKTPKNLISDMDLSLFEAAPSRLCGMREEFIESPRLDNLASCWALFDALIDSANMREASENVSDEDICMAIAYDHEEIGSRTWVGADSSNLEFWLGRILQILMDSDAYTGLKKCMNEVLSNSILISADMAHAVHPNYSDKHQSEHKPGLNNGIVFKTNANQKYATSPMTAALCKAAVSQYNGGAISIQNFVVRNDSPCGSTIGPLQSSLLGVRSIDVGIPSLAMHSCRELCGLEDVFHLKRFFGAMFQHFSDTDGKSSLL